MKINKFREKKDKKLSKERLTMKKYSMVDYLNSSTEPESFTDNVFNR